MNFERVAARFQQRLAETVAKYEADIILLQEQYEEKIAELEAKLKGDSGNEGAADVVPAAEGQ